MRFVVVGGGVAGVCCAEELCRLCPQGSVALVSAGRSLKGVSVVHRLSRTLEELQLVERRLDELPYPNLTLVQGAAAGIDTGAKELLLSDGQRLPYDKLCIAAGARPKQLPASVFAAAAGETAAGGRGGGTPGGPSSARDIDEHAQHAEQQAAQQAGLEADVQEARRRVLTIRDTDSVARLAAQLAHARRAAVVGNGGIALELISGLRGLDVTWIMRHAHIGDAFFDLDAAQFLLEELEQQRSKEAGGGGAQQRMRREEGEEQQQEGEQQLNGHAQLEQRQGEQQQRQGEQQQRQVRQQQQPGGAGEQTASAIAAPSTAAAAPGGAPSTDGNTHGGTMPAAGVLGHAVGPRWVQQLLPAAAAAGSGQAGQGGGEASQGSSGAVALEYGCEVASIQLLRSLGRPQEVARQLEAAQGEPGAAGSSGAGEAAARGPALLLTLTNGRRLEADLVLLAIGVTPALEWVPAGLERGPDGGLRVNRHMQCSDPSVYAAGDSASCRWQGTGESAHWFQMRLWSQARSMGVYAAHCMAGVQDQTGADMAFELFTHVTRFLGRKVVLLGLYNGQGLQEEPAEDLAIYSRVTEGEDRTFVRIILLRGRVQGAVLIGETDLEETFENLIMDQLDVGAYGPALLDPDFELDHVFD